jgi:hypothetical protein
VHIAQRNQKRGVKEKSVNREKHEKDKMTEDSNTHGSDATHPLKRLDSSAGNELLDKVISQREIMQACENLKNGKSCGMDGILNEMIK